MLKKLFCAVKMQWDLFLCLCNVYVLGFVESSHARNGSAENHVGQVGDVVGGPSTSSTSFASDTANSSGLGSSLLNGSASTSINSASTSIASASTSIAVASTSDGSTSSTSVPSSSHVGTTSTAASGSSISVGPDGANVDPEGKWHSFADLMHESYPAKSKVVYLKAFKLFEKFLKSRNQWVPEVVPTELQVLNYFFYLRNELKWAPTTLWSTYARINAVMIRVYGTSLKSYCRVANVLKSYDSGHSVKQASIFTPQQIEDFISDPELSSKYWLVRKVVALVGYFGGFRNIELKSLKFENCELDSMGYWFSFQRSKQRGRLEATTICIPRRQHDWVPVVSDSSRTALDFDPASLIDLYLAELQSDFGCARDELTGDFFRATHGEKGQKFTRLTLGKNTIGRVGVQVATELCLARPDTFTGHCWRRSCGTSASDSGVNVTTLMGMMGWSSPKTAMVYVKKSRTTSLQMSLYLANVQRQNCAKPFPRGPLEEREVVRKSQVQTSHSLPKCALKFSKSLRACPKAVGDQSSEVVTGSGRVALVETVKDEVDSFSTQDLIQDAESDCIEEVENESSSILERSDGVEVIPCNTVSPVSVSGVEGLESVSERGNSLSGMVGSVDPQLSSILQNLNNSGNLTIHFHFDRNNK